MPEPDAPEFLKPAAWHEQLRGLPHRAAVAFALRCAKRVEPLARLGLLQADAYSAGLDVGEVDRSDAVADAASADREAVSAAARADVTYHAAYAAFYAARIADIGHFQVADLKKLDELKLGKPGEPGEPIRWNDSRLGPLWPDGVPTWHAEAVEACRELEDRLHRVPDPNAPPDDPAFVAQVEEYLKAEQCYNEGKFDAYRGEYVFFSNGVIFGHGRNLFALRRVMEEKAAAVGIPPERLVDYFVPGE